MTFVSAARLLFDGCHGDLAFAHPPITNHPVTSPLIQIRRCLATAAAAFAFALPSAQAVELPFHLAGPHKPSPEPFPNLGLLYKNDDHPFLNEVWFLGRYHGQNHWSESSLDREDEGWENRRFRIGGQIRVFKNLTLHAQMVSGADLEPFYNGFTELWASWRFSDAIALTVGQQKHRFTHDRNVSSRYLLTLERSQLTNMFAADYTPAITLSGRIGRWSYYTGVFTNATGRDMSDAFTEYDSGFSFLASATVDVHEFFKTDTAALNFCFLASDAHEGATNLNFFDQGISTALILTDGPASLITEVTAGLSDERGDALGLNIQPGLFLTDKLQLVARYQVAGSNNENGLRAQRRYEREVGLATGDFYQAGYVGLNYYLAGHRAKLMAGIEYSALGGEEQWTASVAVRVFWGPHSRGPFPMVDTLPGLFR